MNEIKSTYEFVAEFSLRLMMRLLYLNDVSGKDAGYAHNNGLDADSPLKSTYVTIEDAFDEVKDAVKGILETLDFVVELHYPTATTKSIAEIETKDFESQAQKAFGVTTKGGRK